MGSGKSTLGKALNKAKAIPFIDLDDYLTVRVGKPISHIFDEGGEKLFRKLEREALLSLIEAKPQNLLLACGGGTPCFGDNMELINQAGSSIYLKNTVDTLYHRLLPQKDQRPLIKDLSDRELWDFIEFLLQKREPYYLKATHVLSAELQHVAHIHSLLADPNYKN
ncbi:MAG: shikimate kinase [Bacteroidota bacterium]